MLATLLLDTDVFAKLGIASLLEHTYALFDVTANDCRRLPALPHMLRRGALPALHGKEACERLIPLAEGMSLAPVASVEWLSRFANVPQIDPGEAQLFASAAEHGLVVMTGDKRSVTAASKIEGIAEALAGRVASLEAVLLGLCSRLGGEQVRSALRPLVAIEDRTDKLVRVCFSDGNPDPMAALLSYFGDLKRNVAPLVLWEPPQERAEQ